MVIEPTSTILHLLLRAGRLCAIPVETAVETMRPLPIESVPGAPNAVRGISLVRGEAVPVVDLGTLLDEPASDPRRLVLTRAGGRCLALAVSTVAGIVGLDGSALEAGRALAREVAAPFIAALVTHGGETITVLDVASILAFAPQAPARLDV